jgi:hypothetical protein
MRYEINENGLTIIADKKDVETLKTVKDEKGDGFNCDDVMFDLLEGLVCNSELEWCSPYDVGALTSAPMLCIRAKDGEIETIFAFMDYQITSVQAELLDNNKVFFIKG